MPPESAIHHIRKCLGQDAADRLYAERKKAINAFFSNPIEIIRKRFPSFRTSQFRVNDEDEPATPVDSNTALVKRKREREAENIPSLEPKKARP